jgi:hypothetical protein
VAGPSALLVSKLHKIHERPGEARERRLDDKDALDVLRLLRAVPTTDLARVLADLKSHDLAGEVTREAVAALSEHFSGPRSAGARMAARAGGALESPEEITASFAILAADPVEALNPL